MTVAVTPVASTPIAAVPPERDASTPDPFRALQKRLASAAELVFLLEARPYDPRRPREVGGLPAPVASLPVAAAGPLTVTGAEVTLRASDKGYVAPPARDTLPGPSLAEDKSGRANHARFSQGAPEWVAGPVAGTALRLREAAGPFEEVVIPHIAAYEGFAGEATLMFWLRVADTGSPASFRDFLRKNSGQGRAYNFFIQAFSNTLRVVHARTTSGEFAMTFGDVGDGRWHHVAYVLAPGFTRAVFDFSIAQEFGAQSPLLNGAGDWRLGTVGDLGFEIAGLQWRDRALSLPEIEAAGRGRPTGLDADMVGYWPMEAALDAAPVLARELVAGRAGRREGLAVYVPGDAYETALRFPGGETASVMRLDSGILDGADRMTFEAMIRLPDFDSPVTPTLLSVAHSAPGANDFVTFFGTSAVRLSVRNDQSIWSGADDIPDLRNRTLRLSVTYDGLTGDREVFIDGVSKGVKPGSAGAIAVAEGGLVLGQEQDSIGGGFDPNAAYAGLLSDVRFWRRIRTAEEMQADAYRRLSGSEEGLAAYFPLDVPPVVAEYRDYPALIKGPITLRQRLFEGEEPAGLASGGLGSIELINADGRLDPWLAYAWAGRPIEIRAGAPDFPLEDFGLVFRGTVADVTWSERTVTLSLTDPRALFGQPIQQSVYRGTGGLEGPEGLAGRPKPKAFGKLTNVPVVLVDGQRLIYQAHDGAVQAISALRDAGVALTFAGDTADILDTTVPAGSYKTDLARGVLRLGATPAGQVTADLEGDVSGGYSDTTAGIVRRIATRLLGINGLADPADLDTPAFAALDARQPASVGLFIDQDPDAAAALNALMGGIGGFWSFTRDGLLTVGRLEAPTGPELDLDERVLVDLERLPSTRPAWRRRVGYRRVWAVQGDNDLAGAVGAAARELYALALRFAEASDTGVLGADRLARDVVTEGFFDLEADARAEAARLLALWASGRALYRARVATGAFRFRLGQSVCVRFPRFGLEAGRCFVITGLDLDLLSDFAVLDLWG